MHKKHFPVLLVQPFSAEIIKDSCLFKSQIFGSQFGSNCLNMVEHSAGKDRDSCALVETNTRAKRRVNISLNQLLI